ncbi:hypothetical protein PM082_003370 [Marasmius tenuissimus]|nr:hypothetical protein PM082_003370 [Marasmius tenuissimus]
MGLHFDGTTIIVHDHFQKTERHETSQENIQKPLLKDTMLFNKFFAIPALTTLAVATPIIERAGQCTTGGIKCCKSVTTAKDPVAALS